jgi:heat shock protein HslJ
VGTHELSGAGEGTMGNGYRSGLAAILLLLAACTVKPPTAGEFGASLPASWEREAPGANSLIRWHLDLLPDGNYQLRTVYLDKPAPNQFDQVGRWQYDAVAGQLQLAQEREPSLLFAVGEDAKELAKLDDAGKPVDSALNPPLMRLAAAALIEPQLSRPGALGGKYWRLARLGDTAIGPYEDRRREPHLLFDLNGSKVAGSGGCNRLGGGFQLDGARLTLKLVSTLMACLNGMELEQRFLDALARVESFRVVEEDGALELLDGEGAVLARLETAEQPRP